MIQRRVLVCVFTLAVAVVPSALAQEHAEPGQAKPCQCRPERVGPCFKVRGSITLYPQAPKVRLTVDSTKRVFGIEGGVPEFLEEDLDVPQNVVTGDFFVCPVTRPKTGTIQLVCIESSSNLVVREKR